MSVEHRCQRHGRPAVATRTRLRPDGTQEVEYLCEIDLAEERMAGRFGGRGSLFDDFFSDFFGERTARGPLAEAPRQVERVDVTEFFSDATRELLQRAAHTALEWGSLDLDTDHLLHAALRDDVVRQSELSPMVLSGAVEPGDRVTVDVLEGELRFDVESGAAAAAEAEAEAAPQPA